MKQSHHASKSQKPKPSLVRLVVIGIMAVAAAGAAIALTVSSDEMSSDFQYQPSTTAVFDEPSTGGEVPAPPGITNPTPYQYDLATDRHYDPFHAHWHAGPPPSEANRRPTSGTAVPAPPGITNPTPYQYDAATNRHYDPVHAHWHDGPPPQ